MKLKPRIKKIIAMLLVALTINTSIFSAAVIPVQASTLPLASELVAALLSIFGYTYGYGTSLDGSNNTNSEMFAEMQATWNAGESFEIDGTEVPDLRVASNFTNFVYESYDFYTSYNNGGVINEYMTQLNEKAFKATGTLVTKTYMDALAEAKSYIANTTEDVLTSEIESVFSVLTDDSTEISGMNTLSIIFGSIIAGIACKSQVDATNTWTNTLDTSIWNPMDLYYREYVYNDITWPIYYYNFFEADTTTSGYTRDFVYDKYVFVIPYMSSSTSLGLYSLLDESYTLTHMEYKGSTLSSEKTYTANEQTYGFERNLSAACYAPDFNYVTTSGYTNALIAYVTEYGWDFNYTDNAETMDATVTDAMASYSGKTVTKSKLLELADALEARAGAAAGTETATSEIAAAITDSATALPDAETSSGTGEYSSILDKILAAITAIAAAIWGFFSEPLAGIKSAIDIFPALLEELGSIVSGIPKSIWEYLEPTVTAIHEEVTAIVSQNTNPWDEDDTERSSDSVSLLNGFALLIFIIIELLKIFWHCLQFIVAIFEIQPSTAFLPDEVIMGLDYLKTLEITGVGLSVYDFLMGLVYILIVFSVVRVLRINIDRIHVPGHGIKKAN